MDRPTLAGILRAHGEDYRRGHTSSATQTRAWRAIVDCRTSALGGVRERCANCGAERHVWRSCRNRHCPHCQTRAKEAWRAARLREVLPVPYAPWVFTLPHALHPLAIRHPRWLYGALFDSAAATLLELAANPRWLGAVPGFSLVLHTWSQDLRMHLHVHALITCGGLDAERRRRTPVRGPRFLFPVQAASKVFRGKFLARLDAAHPSGELPDDPQGAPGAWQARRRALLAHDWVVYAKPPPGGPAQVLDYLARYTHRVALSNDRLLGCDAGQVRLRVRNNATGGKRTLSLPTDTFIGRFLRHVLPAGFKRLRHYGLLACGHKRDRGGAAMLPALRGGALARGRDRHGSSARSARAGAALSGWAAINTDAVRPQSLPMQRPHRQAVARPQFGERDRHRTPAARLAPDRGRLRRWSRAARRDRLLADDPILSRAIQWGWPTRRIPSITA